MGEIVHAEGATVNAEQVIGHMTAGGAPAAAPAAKAEAAPAAAAPAAESDEVLTPSVRRLIAEKGLDAAKIQGSGKHGRVTKEDVEKFLAGAPAAPAKAAAAVAAPVSLS